MESHVKNIEGMKGVRNYFDHPKDLICMWVGSWGRKSHVCSNTLDSQWLRFDPFSLKKMLGDEYCTYAFTRDWWPWPIAGAITIIWTGVIYKIVHAQWCISLRWFQEMPRTLNMVPWLSSENCRSSQLGVCCVQCAVTQKRHGYCINNQRRLFDWLLLGAVHWKLKNI